MCTVKIIRILIDLYIDNIISVGKYVLQNKVADTFNVILVLTGKTKIDDFLKFVNYFLNNNFVITEVFPFIAHISILI